MQRIRQHKIPRILAALAVFWLALAAGCAPRPAADEDAFLVRVSDIQPLSPQPGRKLSVVATTNLVFDTLRVVGGDLINLQAILPTGADPHAYEPTPGDLRILADADLVFINGIDLEQMLHPALAEIASRTPVISLSERIEPLSFAQSDNDHDRASDIHNEIAGQDPHVWLDPNNVMSWVATAADALSAADPQHSDQYRQNASVYNRSIETLHNWILSQVSRIEPADRKLVTDHRALGYFTERYDFELVAAVIPAYSTAAEPSARELTELLQIIRSEHVMVIFVGTDVSTTIASRIAEDTGARVVPLYTGALSPPDGPAGTYLEMMKYNVETITKNLLEDRVR